MVIINTNIFSFYYLKSMKFFALSTALLLIAAKCEKPECGQGKISNSMNFCIEPDYIEGCETYSSPTTCHACEKGYTLNKGLCDALQFAQREVKLPGCLVRSKNKSSCSNCANGFLRKGHKCEAGVKNCQAYSSQGEQCKECKPNYSLVLNQCRLNTLLGCKRTKSDHTCSECWPPFKLNGQHCEVSDCQSLNDYGCTTCQCGFYLDRDRGCKKVDEGCLRYERGKCINCLDHYRLKAGICEIQGCLKYEGRTCIECKQEYNNQNGGCQFKNCVDWARDQCLSCEKGFKVESGICVKEKQFVCTG